MRHHWIQQHVHYGSLRGRRERERDRKLIQRNNHWKFPQSGWENRPPDPGRLKNTKMNTEGLTVSHIKMKLSGFKGKERILKAAREKQTRKDSYGIPIRLLVDFSRNFARQKGSGLIHSKCWWKNTDNQKFYTWENCPSNIKER